MCGIAGIFNTKKGSFNSEITKKMINEINHRGPDFQDYFHDNFISLGHFFY